VWAALLRNAASRTNAFPEEALAICQVSSFGGPSQAPLMATNSLGGEKLLRKRAWKTTERTSTNSSLHFFSRWAFFARIAASQNGQRIGRGHFLEAQGRHELAGRVTREMRSCAASSPACFRGLTFPLVNTFWTTRDPRTSVVMASLTGWNRSFAPVARTSSSRSGRTCSVKRFILCAR